MFKKIVIGIILIFVLAVALVFWATSGITDTAKAFFEKLKSHDYKTAYAEYLSEDFKTKVPLNRFKNFIVSNRLDRFKDIKWGNREINGRFGTLQGTLITDNGGSIPIVLKFVKGENNWKIYAIKKPSAGINTISTNNVKKQVNKTITQIPSKNERLKLAKESVKHFVESIKAKDMKEFYDNIASLWQRQTTPEKLKGVFKPLIQNSTDLTVLENMTPIEDSSAQIDKNGVLKLNIYYQTEPSQVAFELKYYKENGQWKLIGLHVFPRKQ